jgi:hypothetical protein
MKKKTIWIGVIPGIFGYGISVASDTRDNCLKAIKKSYKEFKKSYPNKSITFVKSFEDWGGRIYEIELDKTYFDDFSS